MSRQSNLAKIHIAKKDLGMADDSYRAMLLDVANVDSASKLDFHGQYAVLQRLKELGWKPKRNPMKTGPKSKKLPKRAVHLDGQVFELEIGKKRQSDMIRALWIDMHKQGIIRDRSEMALMKYIKRMTNGKFEAPQFCDAQEAQMIIEALKKWQKRELDKRHNKE